jgi:hypothetical protein
MGSIDFADAMDFSFESVTSRPPSARAPGDLGGDLVESGQERQLVLGRLRVQPILRPEPLDLALDLLRLGRRGLKHVRMTGEGLDHERVSPRRGAARSSEQRRIRV